MQPTVRCQANPMALGNDGFWPKPVNHFMLYSTPCGHTTLSKPPNPIPRSRRVKARCSQSYDQPTGLVRTATRTPRRIRVRSKCSLSKKATYEIHCLQRRAHTPLGKLCSPHKLKLPLQPIVQKPRTMNQDHELLVASRNSPTGQRPTKIEMWL